MKIIKVSDLRQNLQDIIDRVFYTEETIIVFRRNKPRAIITPIPKDDKNVSKFIKEHEAALKEVLKK